MPKTKEDSVLFIVLNYNGWKETQVCIQSIFDQTYSQFHILLIDNGSGDESLKKLQYLESNISITFIKKPINLGFAGGVNVGINYAIENKYPFIALLNNDARLTPQWLEMLMKSINKTSSSIVTGLLLDKSGIKIESTADAYSTWGLPFPAQRGEPASHAVDSRFIFGGTAGASLYRTTLFKEIGLFDEKFFAYYEDTDISFRSQLSGHTAYYEEKAIAYHNHGTTSNKIPGFTIKQTFKNLPLFFLKNTPKELLFSTGFRFFFYLGLIYLRAIIRGQFIPATQGIFMGIMLFPHAFRERLRIQKSKVVSVKYIRSISYPGLPPINKNSLNRLMRKGH